MPYSPALWAPFASPPVLMMVAPDDEMVHADYGMARTAYELMPEPKECYDMAGSHFRLLYHPSALLDEASGIQTAFLTRWLSR